MAIELTARALSALKQTAKEPNIVLQIDGIDRVFGGSIIKKFVRFGDGSKFGDPTDGDPLHFYFGGLNEVGDQDNIITLNGTSTSIKQTLDPFKGQGASISALSIALIDTGYVTELISPGVLVDDILQRQCKVFFGFNGTAWPNDYAVVFRGLITDVQADPGKVILQLSHADDKKRTNIFKRVDLVLVAGIDDSTEAIALEDATGVLIKVEGPDGLYDSAFKSYVRIEDELIEFDGITNAATNVATISIASPGVVTLADHGFPDGLPITFSTTGALPTGLVAGTMYFVKYVNANTFKLAATLGGADINTTGSQSGVHSVINTDFLTGVTRGNTLTPTPAAHDADQTVTTYYTLTGNAVDLALKLMASGRVTELQGGASQPFVQDIPYTSVNVGGSERHQNALFFKDVNVEQEYGLVPGDWLHEAGGSAYAENRVRDKQVLEIIRGETGDFVIIDLDGDDDFIDDISSLPDNELICAFTSQFATLPDGCKFRPDEIDVVEHLRLKQIFLSSVDYTFYLKEGIENAAEFIEDQIYKPIAAYSLPRKARASMGYHSPPIPGVGVVTFDETNIKNASKIRVRRSTNKNFWNEIVYKFDEHATQDDAFKFKSGVIAISADSKTRIANSPNRTLTIESKGLRTTDQAVNIATAQAARRLRRYEYGAEVFTFETMLDKSFEVEIGDIIILDGSNLNLPDIKTGTKGMAPRLLEVQNKDFQLKTGAVTIEAVDTKFDGAARYGLMTPSSVIKSGSSTTEFIIEESFSGRFGSSEWQKWKNLGAASVLIRSADWSQQSDAVLVPVTSNSIVLSTPLDFVPTAGMVMELSHYDDDDVTDQIKLIYAHMRDSDFADGSDQYVML